MEEARLGLFWWKPQQIGFYATLLDCRLIFVLGMWALRLWMMIIIIFLSRNLGNIDCSPLFVMGTYIVSTIRPTSSPRFWFASQAIGTMSFANFLLWSIAWQWNLSSSWQSPDVHKFQHTANLYFKPLASPCSSSKWLLAHQLLAPYSSFLPLLFTNQPCLQCLSRRASPFFSCGGKNLQSGRTIIFELPALCLIISKNFKGKAQTCQMLSVETLYTVYNTCIKIMTIDATVIRS